MKKIKFGIIGCSSISKKTTIPSILKSKLSDLEIIGSRLEKKSKTFAKAFYCKKYGGYLDVLENPNVDAVYISLPISLQEKWVIKSAKAGKHIICEKSATTSYNSAKKMLKECKKNNVRLMEGFSFRFHPQHNKVLKIIKQKKIGKPFYFFGRYSFTLPISSNNFRFNKKLGGGSFNDVGCYLVCSSRMVFDDKPISVSCNLEFDKNLHIDMNGTILINFSNNRQAFGLFGYNLPFQSTYTIFGNLGNIILQHAFNIKKNMSAKIFVNSKNGQKYISLLPSNQSILMIDNFCNDIIRPHSGILNSENDLLLQSKVMEAARQSSLRNKIIRVSQIK